MILKNIRLIEWTRASTHSWNLVNKNLTSNFNKKHKDAEVFKTNSLTLRERETHTYINNRIWKCKWIGVCLKTSIEPLSTSAKGLRRKCQNVDSAKRHS